MKHKARLDVERMRALAILAENPEGCSRAIMLARGFPLALLNRPRADVNRAVKTAEILQCSRLFASPSWCYRCGRAQGG
jgi:hypothetical protein